MATPMERAVRTKREIYMDCGEKIRRANERAQEAEEKLEDMVKFVENFTQIYVNAPPTSLNDAISYTLESMKILKGIAVTHKGRENNE